MAEYIATGFQRKDTHGYIVGIYVLSDVTVPNNAKAGLVYNGDPHVFICISDHAGNFLLGNSSSHRNRRLNWRLRNIILKFKIFKLIIK